MAEFVLTITLPSDIVINCDQPLASHVASKDTMFVINYLSRTLVCKLALFLLFCFYIAYLENLEKELDMLISLTW